MPKICRNCSKPTVGESIHCPQCLIGALERVNHLPKGSIKSMLADQEGRCGLCGGLLGIGDGLTVDHKSPIADHAKPGESRKDVMRRMNGFVGNVWLLCAPCNSSKGTRPLAEMLRVALAIVEHNRLGRYADTDE